MNLDEWKKRNRTSSAKDIHMYGMPGFEYDIGNDYIARCYPEQIVTSIQEHIPQLTIESICYFLNKELEQVDESIEIKGYSKGRFMRAELSLTFYENQVFWEFNHNERNSEWNDPELHQLYFQLFQKMIYFLEQNGAHRLLLVMTTPEKEYPHWLKEKIKKKDDEHEL